MLKIGQFSKIETDIINKEVNSLKLKSVDAALYSPEGSYKNPKVRSGKIYFPSTTECFNTFSIVQSMLIQNNQDIDFDFTNIASIQYTYYGVGNFFDWHQDIIGEQQGLKRAFTMSVNLSEESSYTGGELSVFHELKEVILPKHRGSFISFPAFLYHKAYPILSGIREALVVWVKSDEASIKELRKKYIRISGEPCNPSKLFK